MAKDFMNLLTAGDVGSGFSKAQDPSSVVGENLISHIMAGGFATPEEAKKTETKKKETLGELKQLKGVDRRPAESGAFEDSEYRGLQDRIDAIEMSKLRFDLAERALYSKAKEHFESVFGREGTLDRMFENMDSKGVYFGKPKDTENKANRYIDMIQNMPQEMPYELRVSILGTQVPKKDKEFFTYLVNFMDEDARRMDDNLMFDVAQPEKGGY